MIDTRDTTDDRREFHHDMYSFIGTPLLPPLPPDYAQDTIDELHSNGKWVVCYISIGTYEEWREDADDFPAAAIGSPMEDWDGENWLDINNEVRFMLLIQDM